MGQSSASRRDTLRIYSWVLGAAVFVGEALTLAFTDKYLPQGMDEIAFVVCMVAFTSRPLSATRLGLMLGAWCFLLGSLYTMLFSRLDPQGGTGERIPGLVALMLGCAIGAAWTWRRLQQARPAVD